jgi:UDPglucose 6-dehydrogenase
VPIHEPGLGELLAQVAGRLHFSTELAPAVEHARLLFVSVGTPPTYSGDADLRAVNAVIGALPEDGEGERAIVMKSTVPVGTGTAIARELDRQGKGGYAYVSCPEFLREGSALGDFRAPDRVVVGDDGGWGGDAVVELYRPLDAPLVRTDVASAEMVKLASNAFLATKISFINEIAALCERVGADVKDVSKGIGLDGRIGNKFLHAGPGYGGSCFPKDTRALARIGQDHGCPMRITETVIEVNDGVKRRMIDKIVDLCGGSVNGRSVAVLGVTFKPETDDMREAPSLTIVPALVGGGAKVRVVDPQGRREGVALLPGVDWLDDPYAAATGADLVIILTEWNAFRALDLRRLAQSMAVPRMADLRNVYNRDVALQAGFTAYEGVGR